MLIVFPHPPGTGGPGSFQSRFESVLAERGWTIRYDTDGGNMVPSLVMVVGGTRRIQWLNDLKRKGVPIVYRLDGRLWLHRIRGLRKAPSSWLGSEIRNGLAQLIHGRIADYVVYQSDFVKQWWASEGWWQPARSTVISNGIDLDEFRPDTIQSPSLTGYPDVVCVEGHLDYSPYAIELINFLAKRLDSVGARLIVFGGFSNPSRRQQLDSQVDYRGALTRQQVAPVYRGRIYLSLDVNPACPNTVAEALASGSPVIGFDTGAVKELVGETAGCVVPFGGNPWKGDKPEFSALYEAYLKVVESYADRSTAARMRAEALYGINEMVDAYIGVIEQVADR